MEFVEFRTLNLSDIHNVRTDAFRLAQNSVFFSWFPLHKSINSVTIPGTQLRVFVYAKLVHLSDDKQMYVIQCETRHPVTHIGAVLMPRDTCA